MRILLALLGSLVVLHAQSNLSAFSTGEGVTGQVNAIAVQPDGKVVIGGSFSAVNGAPRSNIARLNPDGTLDSAFSGQGDLGLNGQVNALAIDSTGGILAGGSFTRVGNTEAMNIVRYNADGTVDANFGGPDPEVGANGPVLALAVQADGKIVVGGLFSTVYGKQRRGVARLNAGGIPDAPAIAEQGLSGAVNAVAGAGGTFVAGGRFTVENQPARGLVVGK